MTIKMEKRDTIIPFTIVTFKVSSRTWEYRPQLRKDQSVGKEVGQDHRKANDQIPSTNRHKNEKININQLNIEKWLTADVDEDAPFTIQLRQKE